MGVGRAYTPDLTVSNDANVAYLAGSEFEDGSVRLEPPEAGEADVPHIELRTNGIWANTGLLLSPETLFLGDDVSLSGVGSHLQVNSAEGGRKSLLLEVRFDDAGTGQPLGLAV